MKICELMRCLNILKVVAAVLLASQVVSQGASYQLAWNSNPEPDIVAYKVHVGTSSRSYTRTYSVTSPSVSISDLPDAPAYYFAVTAVNSAGQESDFSSEVSTISPNTPVLTSTLSATSLQLSVSAPEGTVVRFEASTNLQNWQFLANRTANSQGVAILNQPRSSMLPVRFYRSSRP
jgi:hypothetical protein